MTRVVCHQSATVLGDLPGNAERAAAAIAAASSAGADVVVLPELVTTGYLLGSREEAAAVAVDVEHPLFGGWAAAAGGAVVVAGFAERGQDGSLFNSAVVLDASGVLAVHRKGHLWGAEPALFEPGHAAPPVVATRHGRIGVCVCYELDFPETTRALALGGADLVAVPTAWLLASRPAGERPPGIVTAMAAARANRVPVAVADRSGAERGRAWTRATSIVDADGWVVATTDAQDGVASADLDLADPLVLVAREQVMADRRPALYGALDGSEDVVRLTVDG